MYLVTQVANQFSAHNPYPAGRLPGVVKPADDHFMTEMVANAV
jgi:hypothetical protein